MASSWSSPPRSTTRAGCWKGGPRSRQFDPPTENIVWVSVDAETGKRATDLTRQPVLEAYFEIQLKPEYNPELPPDVQKMYDYERFMFPM